MEKTRKIILFSCRKKGQDRKNEIEGESRVGIEQIKKRGGCEKRWRERVGRRGKGKMEGDRERKGRVGSREKEREGRGKKKQRARKERKGR